MSLLGFSLGFALGRALGWWAGLWRAKSEREYRLRMRRFWRLIHRARDHELRTNRIWTFILLSSKTGHQLYRMEPRRMVREVVESPGSKN